MLRLPLILFALVVALFTSMSFADLVVSDASVRLLPASLPNTAAYFTLKNTGHQDVTLVGAYTDVAQKTEMHNHVMRSDVMRMEHQTLVVIPANQTVSFAPGGLHLMIFGLKAPLHKEQGVKLELITQDGDRIPFDAVVGEPIQHAHHH